MSCDCDIEVTDGDQRSVLITLLLINAVMFLLEMIFGVLAQSTALIADALDMLADAAVYGVSLYAVGKAATGKIKAAQLSGVFQIILALGVAVEIIRRTFWGSDPEPLYMVGVSMVALAANMACLVLIAKHRDGDVHMRASWIFSKNDVLANLGVILSGVLVYTLDSRWPDLVVGAIIVAIVFRGGLTIVADAQNERGMLEK